MRLTLHLAGGQHAGASVTKEETVPALTWLCAVAWWALQAAAGPCQHLTKFWHLTTPQSDKLLARAYYFIALVKQTPAL